VRLELARLNARIASKGVAITATEEALDYIADIGYDRIYGARPLKRTIQREVETPLSKKILAGECNDGSQVIVGIKNDRLSIVVIPPV
jgi:ATP-dependent Clp protease ATP-binding subunit ClpB